MSEIATQIIFILLFLLCTVPFFLSICYFISMFICRKKELEEFRNILSEHSEDLPLSAIAKYYWSEGSMGNPLLIFESATIFFKSYDFESLSGTAFSKIQEICLNLNPNFRIAPDPYYVNMREYTSDPEQSLNSPNIVIH